MAARLRGSLLVAVAAFALGAASVGLMNGRAEAQATTRANGRLVRLFLDVTQLAQRRHLRPTGEEAMVEAGLRGMLNSLDGRSDYLDPDSFEALVAPSADAGEIGLFAVQETGGALVFGVEPGSPADAAGIAAGDRVLGVAGRGLIGAIEGELDRRLRGRAGSPVKLIVQREGGRVDELEIVRAAASSAVKSRLEGKVGYLKVAAFEKETARQAGEAIAKLWAAEPAMSGLVLDLRGSPGGYLETGAELADLFLTEGPLFEVRGRSAGDVKRFAAKSGEVMRGRPMVVLVDPATRSAAEALAASLQERGRAKVAGLRTYGAGAVFNLFPLLEGDAGAIKLSTGLIYTAGGKPVQKAGVVPDAPVAQSQAQADRIKASRFATIEAAKTNAPGEAPAKAAGAPPLVPPAGADPKADFQLAQALAMIPGGTARR